SRKVPGCLGKALSRNLSSRAAAYPAAAGLDKLLNKVVGFSEGQGLARLSDNLNSRRLEVYLAQAKVNSISGKRNNSNSNNSLLFSLGRVNRGRSLAL